MSRLAIALVLGLLLVDATLSIAALSDSRAEITESQELAVTDKLLDGEFSFNGGRYIVITEEI